MTLTKTVKSILHKPVIYLSTLLIAATTATSCYTQPTTRDTNLRQQTEVYQEEDNNRTFIGRPIQMEHKGNDLEFLLKSEDEQTNKSLYITIHEDADFSNRKNLELVEGWIRESRENPDMEFRVQGFYKPDRITQFYEEGSLDPYVIIKMTQNDSTGAFEEAVWTDKKDSPIYTDVHVNIVLDHVYYPGHHIWLTHYPLGFYPYWDNDGDGIPNRWDPWPNVFGPWVDLNHNHIWDWYDPFYSYNEVPYWGYWHNHYGHHDRFMINWQNYYNNDFKNHKDFKDRNREVTRIRNNLGGRNPGVRDPIRNPGVRDPIINKNPVKEREQIKDRTSVKREPIKEREQIKDRTSVKEREQIEKDRFPPVRRDDTKRNDVEKKTYERQKETRTYNPPKNTYQPPKRAERTYTQPPRNNTQTPRREQVTTPRNNTQPPKQNTTPSRNGTNNNQQRSRDKK